MTVKELIMELMEAPIDADVMLCCKRKNDDGCYCAFCIDNVSIDPRHCRINFTDWRDFNKDFDNMTYQERKEYLMDQMLSNFKALDKEKKT